MLPAYPPELLEAADDQARSDLAQAFARMRPQRAGEATFSSWSPAGIRTTKKRRFTALAVDGEPLLVSKTGLDHDDLKVAIEWVNLATLSLPSGIDHGRPVERTQDSFIMSYVPAVDLPAALMQSSSPRDFRSLLFQVLSQVARIHVGALAGQADDRDGVEVAHQYVRQPFLGTARSRDALEQALVGPTHGDLAPWNVRYDSTTGRVGFIDWEDYRAVGIPGIDVVNLLVTLGLVVFSDYRTEGVGWLYEQVLESEHWYALLLRDAVLHYSGITGQSARGVIDLLPLHCHWLITRLANEGRDATGLYYAEFADRYVDDPPAWTGRLRA